MVNQPLSGGRFFFEEIRSGSHTTRIERQGKICSLCLTMCCFVRRIPARKPPRCGSTVARLVVTARFKTVAVYRMDAAALADAQGEHVY